MTWGCLIQQHLTYSKLNKSANQMELAGKLWDRLKKTKKVIKKKKKRVDLWRDYNVKAIQIKNLQIQTYEYVSIITYVYVT